MSALQDTIASLGAPALLRTLNYASTPVAAVARWRHDDVLVDVAPSDTVRLAVSLADNGAGRATAPRRVRVGSISIYPDYLPTRFALEGRSDILQIFLRKSALDNLADGAFVAPELFDSHDGQLQSAALQVLVGAVRSDPDDGLLIEQALHRIAGRLREHSDRRPAPRLRQCPPAYGGLSFAARRRVAALIDAALHDGGPAPTLDGLAGAARLSVSHFIRAYKDETGFTPHRHMLVQRLERAIELLGRVGLSVADVADRTGFGTPAHFVATFRRTMGVAPGAVRRALTS